MKNAPYKIPDFPVYTEKSSLDISKIGNFLFKYKFHFKTPFWFN